MNVLPLERAATAWSLTAEARPSVDWDPFVLARPDASIYLRSGWTQFVTEVFGHRSAFIEARAESKALVGVLPIVQQRSLLLGNFATSIPFFNYGGALCDDATVAHQLMMRAKQIAQEWGCSYLEFRDVQPRSGDWLVRKDKVSMVLQLPASFEALSKQLGSKLRSQVKRADREQSTVKVGGIELVEDFYGVFAENMRDLGTPVYPKRFFRELVQRFPNQCRILIVEQGGVAGAAAFLVVDGTRAEIPWASCRSAAKPLGFNMKLYWEVLKWCVEQGCTRFDFGRSTADSGTFNFKKQWGAEPVQLYWHRWERRARPVTANEVELKRGGLMERASDAWKRLPLPVANTLGPLLSPKLPW
jgi:serine/alanine adding enzyme